MRYALVNQDDVVVNVIELEEGADYTPPEGCKLAAERDWPPVKSPPSIVPISTIVDGIIFLSRLTQQEYQGIVVAARDSPQLGLWMEMLRMRGSIDVTGKTALEAKAGVVAMKLLSQERADTIFAAN